MQREGSGVEWLCSSCGCAGRSVVARSKHTQMFGSLNHKPGSESSLSSSFMKLHSAIETSQVPLCIFLLGIAFEKGCIQWNQLAQVSDTVDPIQNGVY